MAKQLFANNATGYLNTSISDTTTTIQLDSGNGLLFPNPTSGDYFYATLSNGTSIEIVKCTAKSSDFMSIVRAQQGTVAVSFAAGSKFELRATKENFNQFIQRSGDLIDDTPVGSVTPASGAFTTLSASGTISGTGFSNYLASPPAIGGTAPAAGSFTTLSASGAVSGVGFSNYLSSPPAIGGTVPAGGTFTTLSATGDLTLSGSGKRITGDFSNATIANRVMFQTSTVNGLTGVAAIPNGASDHAGFYAYSSTDPANSSWLQARVSPSASDVRLASDKTGTGTYLPMTFYTGGSERMRIDTSGNVGIGATPTEALTVYKATAVNSQVRVSNTINATGVVVGVDNAGMGYLTNTGAAGQTYIGNTNSSNASPLYLYTKGLPQVTLDSAGNLLVTNATGGLGYGTGSGGTVTQATSRTTAVTLNKPTGQITMFTAAGSATYQTFTVNNSLVTTSDTVVLTQRGGGNIYNIIPLNITTGSFQIAFASVSGTASDTPIINFDIIKGAAA